jgi:hypothetical protein
VFENRVWRIFGPKRDEATEGWRKQCGEGVNKCYHLPGIKLIKSRCMRGAGHIAHMETIKVRTKFFLREAEL